jgi:hypothetical protein
MTKEEFLVKAKALNKIYSYKRYLTTSKFYGVVRTTFLFMWLVRVFSDGERKDCCYDSKTIELMFDFVENASTEDRHSIAQELLGDVV